MDIKGKRFLVTGAGGFVGRHLTEKLISLGARVTALVRKNKASLKTNNNLTILEKDLLEINKEDTKGIDVVIHLAAITDLPDCQKNPKKAYEVNVLGTISLLENSKDVEKFVYVSSLAVYGNSLKLPSGEDDSPTPIETYAATKVAAEYFTSTHCNSINLPFCIARLFSVYGPGQKNGFVIPRIVSQAIAKDELDLKNTDTTRDFIYIGDVVDALINLSVRGNGIYNVGTGIETSIMEVISNVEKILNKKLAVKTSGEKKLGVSRSRSDPTKMVREIGWKYSINLQEGLKMTLDSYKNG